MSNTVIVTRHTALIQVIVDLYDLRDVQVLTHITDVNQIKGKHVFGVLPMHLAAEAECITVINLNLPPELRGVELTEDQIRQYMTEPATYKVVRYN